ncbi:MAG: hypothetical protein SGJ00_09110, partial [bacterium]|nr:hypothetical protein [bacterium]
MNIEKVLAAPQSKVMMTRVVEYIGADTKRLTELMDVLKGGDYLLSQHAVWPLAYVAENHPELFVEHLPFLIGLLGKPNHVAVKRNILRLLFYVELPESELGILADKCFHYIQNLDETGAVKAFSMSVLYKICLKEPDLFNELIPTLEDLIPFGTPAVVSRGKNILMQYKKSLNQTPNTKLPKNKT